MFENFRKFTVTLPFYHITEPTFCIVMDTDVYNKDKIVHYIFIHTITCGLKSVRLTKI